MEVKALRANFDYESALFGKNSAHSSSIVKELEYLMFYDVRFHKFYSSQTYSNDFLESVKKYRKKGFTLTSNNSGSANWWGKLEDFEKERQLNSKLFCKSLCSFHGLYHPSMICSSEDFPSLIKQHDHFPAYVRTDGSFSGKGLKVFNKEVKDSDLSFLRGLEDKTLLWGPWYNRILDFCLWQNKKSTKVWINKINRSGSYNGTLYCPDQAHYKPLLGDMPTAIELALSMTKNLRRDLQKNYAAEDFKIDSFVYSYNNRIALVPVIEINYRKTMGEINFLLSGNYPGYRYSELILLTNDDEIKTSGNAKCLTPPGGNYRFRIFHHVTNSRKDLRLFSF